MFPETRGEKLVMVRNYGEREPIFTVPVVEEQEGSVLRAGIRRGRDETIVRVESVGNCEKTVVPIIDEQWTNEVHGY
jgi:hypothetical protein